MRRGSAVAASVVAMVVAGQVLAQGPGGEGQRRRGEGAGWPRPEEATHETVATVVSNAVIAKAIGLTGEQTASLKDKLNPEKIKTALAAERLAQTIVTVLSDGDIALDLGLTAAQREAVKTKITAALIREAFSAEEIDELSRAASGRGQIEARMRGMRDRMMQEYDKDGDGQLSEEERGAVRDAWTRGRGGDQGGERAAGRGGERGVDGGGERGLPDRIRQFDTDGDGKLSEEEREAARAARIKE